MKLSSRAAVESLFAAAGLFGQCRKNVVDFFRIQTAVVYLKGVEIVRDLLLYQLGILVCSMFLVFGIILMEGALIFFLPLQPETRASVALMIGVLDSLVALGLMGYFLSSSRWLRKAQKYHEYLNEFMEEETESSSNGHPKKHRRF